MFKKTVPYHIRLYSHRTTISLDKIISDLLAIKLGVAPKSPEAHRLVQQQLNKYMEKDPKRPAFQITRYSRDEVILDLVDKMLSEKYLDYFIEGKI